MTELVPDYPGAQDEEPLHDAAVAAGNILGLLFKPESTHLILQDKRIIAAETLLDTRRKVQQKHNLESINHDPPSPNKYPDWFKWDQAFASEMFYKAAEFCWQQAGILKSRLPQIPLEQQSQIETLIKELGQRADTYFQSATGGLRTSFAGMDKTGFMGNSRFLTKSGIMQAGFERKIVEEGGNNASVYTQPVLEPMAILTGYKAAITSDPDSPEAAALLKEFYGPLKHHLSYFRQFLGQGEKSRLLGVPHPHATGRDSDRIFDHAKNRIPRKGEATSRLTDLRNAKRDYQYALNRTREIVEAKGDWSKIREGFWDVDVMFNCIYIDSLYEMAELAGCAGKERDKRRFLDLAEEMEAEMQTLWDPKAWNGNGAFVNLDKDHNAIEKVSIGSLGAFLLRDLSVEQLESMMNLVETSFNTPYGIPCTPQDGPDAGSHFWEIERIWGKDESWDSANYIILEGMMWHAERQDLPIELRQRLARFAIKVDESSNEALDKYFPPSEFRSAMTGKPRRRRVKQFGWALLPRFMDAKTKLRHLVHEDHLPETA